MRTGEYNVVGYETLTIADSATTLTGGVTGAKSFTGKLETGPVRARGDGTSPTTSEGILLSVGDIVTLSSSEIDNTKFIRTTSTSGVLKGHYHSIEAAHLS
jgi:hypothetical protein